jgi:hypothetical protein
MSGLDRLFEEAASLMRKLDAEQHFQRRKKRAQRKLRKFVRLAGLLFLSSVVIVVAMISTGLLFGPRGIEGLLALPAVLFSTWAAILYFGLRTRPAPKALPAGADVKQLPAQTEEWLEAQRALLPAAARPTVDRILHRLETMAAQVESLDPKSAAAHEVRRLIGEELPELVQGYRKLPRQLQAQNTTVGKSPDRQLVEGLATIDEQIERMQADLAEADLRALATQQRYLELKYKKDKKLE